MVARGFSEDVAQIISTSHRPSISAIYNSQWDVFCRWCRDERDNLDPLSATVPVIADFLQQKFVKIKVLVGTLRGYRTVITQTLQSQAGAHLTQDVFLRNLISNSGIERLRSTRSLPSGTWR